MTTRTARRAANVVAVVTIGVLVISSVPPLRGPSSSDPNDTGYIVAMIVGLSIYLAIGRAIVRRDPANTIGWMLLLIPLITAVSLANGVYATTALVDRPGTLPLGIWSAWLDRWLLPVMLSSFIYIFLLYPDGHLPSKRWRPALALTIAGTTATALSFALTPGRMTGSQAHLDTIHVANPLGLDAFEAVVDAMTVIGSLSLLLSAALAGVAVIVRYRRAGPETRQQIRWLELVGITFLVALLLMMVSGFAEAPDIVGNVLFTVMFATLALGIPAACGIAILKYHLYDLDIVVRKTVVFGLLAAFIAVVYAAIVVGIGAVVGSRGSGTLSFVAAAALAVLFQPARDRARRVADRLVYGTRATPYEVLADFSERVGEAYVADDVLARMARVLAEGTGAESSTVWLRVGDRMRPEASFPEGTPPPEALPDDAVEVRHRGEALGALSVRMPANDPLNPTRVKLVNDLAGQAGFVLRNVRLIEELRASRQRLVAAQDEERRKLERDLHDGAQQQLVALTVQLKLARTVLDRDTAKAGEMLEALQGTAGEALEDLRDLARGIYPPLLADQGLGAALASQARKAAVPTTVESDGIGRYPRDVESTIYFCALEALNNVAKYAGATRAQIRLEQSDGRLTFEVNDDGAGFDPASRGFGTGLQGMADRLDAIGGELEIESEPGRGTVVRGRVPTAHERQPS